MIWTEHSASRAGQGRAVQGWGSAGLGRNRRSEWGGHIFKGKMNIIKMITAIPLRRCHRASEASRQASSHCNRFGVKYKQILYSIQLSHMPHFNTMGAYFESLARGQNY